MKQTNTIWKFLVAYLRRLPPVLVFLTCASPILSAQESGAITGRVFDAVSGEPIQELRVELSGTDRSAVTDLRGAFRIGPVPTDGPVVLHFEHASYGARTESVSVRAGEEALLRILLAKRATPLEPVVVEVLARDDSPNPADGAASNVITRKELDELAGSQQNVLGVLEREVPGIRVSNRGTSPARFCVEFQGIAKTLRDDPSFCHYPLLVVDQSRVNRRVVEVVLQTLELGEVRRIEMIRPAEAGVQYGTGSQYGVLVIQTRTGVEKPAQIGASAVAPDLQPRSTYNWALEPESHSTYKTLGATFLGNAAGVALGLWIGSQCMDYDRLYMDFFYSRCGKWKTAGSRIAAVGLPILASTLAARWAGQTRVSRGDWKKTAGVATIVLLPGYILAASGLGEKESVAEELGEVMISIGVPLATTAADRLFRKIRSGDGGRE